MPELQLDTALLSDLGLPWMRVGPGGRLDHVSPEARALMADALPADLAHALNLTGPQLADLLSHPGPWRGSATLFRGEAPPIEVRVSKAAADGESTVIVLHVEVEPLIALQESLSEVNSALTNLTRERAKQAIRLQRALDQVEAHKQEIDAQAEELQMQNEELDTAYRRLVEVDKLKNRFYAQMNHELRTPLNSIIGFAEDALDGLAGPLNDEIRQYFETILRSGRRQLALVSDVLDLARLQSGKIPLHRETLALQGLVDDVAASMKALLQRKQQTLTFDLPADLPPLRVDPGRITQVVTNLLSNAHKYTGEGGQIRITARPDGDFVRVAVSDTGNGIAESDLGSLFEEFYQVRGRVSPDQPGTGLGLAITRQLVELHGGTISVESQLGQGTTFAFTLPAA